MPSAKVSREMQRFEHKLTREILWVYILSLLKKKPSHAYALRREIDTAFGFLPGGVSAYVVLYKLESRGFVSAKYLRNRKVYSITKAGNELLAEAKRSISEKQKMLF